MRTINRAGGALAVAATIAALAACSSSSGGTQPKKTVGNVASPIAHATSAAAAPSVTTSAHTVAAPSLSGKWAGHYTGAFQGTFTVNWRQSGTKLRGTITLPDLNQSDNISGTVQGGSIRFGTVGAEAIQYNGTVSGNSMSGSWKISPGAAASGGGSWSATKS